MPIDTPHPYKAERSELLVGTESAQKEAAAPTRYPGFAKDEQEPPDLEVDWIEGRYTGAGRTPHQHYEGPHSFEGSLNVVPYDGWPVAWLLGAEATSGSDPTTHTITPKGAAGGDGAAPPTVTVEANYLSGPGGTDFSRGIVGVAPDSGTIQQNNEEELTVDMDVVGLGLTADTVDGSRTPTTGVSLPDRQPWTFKKASSNLSLFGTTFARMEDFQLDVENNLSPETYIEDSEAPEPYELLYGDATLSWTVDLAITDSSLYTELADATEGGFTATIAFTKETNETLTITSNNTYIESAPHPLPEEGKAVSSVELATNDLSVVVDDPVTSGKYLATV
jgi:hypothetical protein